MPAPSMARRRSPRGWPTPARSRSCEPTASGCCDPEPAAFDGVDDLDSSRLEAARGALGPHEIAYQHGVGNVVSRVRSDGGHARRAVAARDRRSDRGDRPRGQAHAPEDDVLRTEAEDRHGLPDARLVDVPGAARAQQGGEVAGALLAREPSSWRDVSVAYSGRSTSRNTPIGVGVVGLWLSRASANARPGSSWCSSWTRMRVLADVGDVDDARAGRRCPSRRPSRCRRRSGSARRARAG